MELERVPSSNIQFRDTDGEVRRQLDAIREEHPYLNTYKAAIEYLLIFYTDNRGNK